MKSKQDLNESLKTLREKVQDLREWKVGIEDKDGNDLSLDIPADWAENPVIPESMIRRLEHKVLNDETLAIQFDCTKGGKLTVHKHKSEEKIVCLAGKMRVVIYHPDKNPETFTLVRHDSMIIPAMVDHSFICLKDGAYIISWLRDEDGIAYWK